MANVLNTGTSALLSLQRAISTTGHNIANVNTEGFSRQTVNFAALPAQLTGTGFIGTGVTISGVSRSFDQYLTADVRDRSSSAAGAETLADLTGRISNILADPSTGLGPALDGFFAAAQDVANNPGSIPERQVLLGQGDVLADRFQYLNGRFQDLDQEANLRIETAVEEINIFAASIAELNEQIVQANNTGNTANDLMDSRDQLITRLSEVVGVDAVPQGDGAINIFIGKGQSIVVGNTSSNLVTFPDSVDASRTNIGFSGLATPTDSGQFLTGGVLGAVLEFRGEVLDSARSQLGLIAVGITETVNQQQRLGIDLNGDFGADFFTASQPAVSPARANTGTGEISAVVEDVASLTGDRYELRYDGTEYTLTNASTGDSQTGAGPSFSVDGVSISVSGAPANGDAYLILPVDRAAGIFSVTLDDPSKFAAAAPLRSSTSLDNAGSSALSDLTVDDVSGLPLGGAVTLTFNPDALGAGVPGFDVTGIAGGPIAYDPATDAGGVDVSLGGFSFRLEGSPATGDSFGLEDNSDGSGDNRNALALSSLQDTGSLNGGRKTFQEAYAGVFTEVAVRSRQATNAAETEGALLQQAIGARNSSQGVNLDEEAANLLRYQQAYQAAAQVIAVADEVFQTLLSATRR
ncbi:MAG: flagellar hook-associated protein FlgK [Congregibacter sp.]